ncbi:MAG: AEC family transporter [Rhodobacteraceae bacterium]|nr:AEC family transporter [Alphaproteobacteria bacterium]MBT8475952.1 AEC family transporter [Alphaproteobacteria bacterium]NNK68303.1 AEC family transporter [Paracoccaceae bacterium]
MQALIEVILPVFLVIGFGYVAVWRNLFSDAGVEGLTKFTQNFAIPCLLFDAIARLDLTAVFDPALLGSFYLGAGLGFLAGLFGARLIFGRPWEDCVAIGFCTLFSNSVLLGLPITERAYGTDALAANFAIVALHAPFCYGVGVTVMEIVRNQGAGVAETSRKVLRAMFRNALVIGIVLGFIVNLSGITLPLVIDDALSLIISAALPAALFGLGGVLYRYRPEGDLRVILYVCAVSLILHPAIVWSMGKATALPDEALRSAVLTAAMAPGINTYIFANMYGAARRVAASAVLIGTALSIVTAWVWLGILP